MMANTNTPDADDGATPKEQLLYAARSGDEFILNELITGAADADATAKFLNTTTDPLGNTALHLAAQYGEGAIVDELLDQEGLEVDPTNRIDGDTPLHVVIKAMAAGKLDHERGFEIADMLIEAGADPRARNKQKMKPADVADARDTKLKQLLQRAEYAALVGNDVVQEDDEDGGGSESD